MDFSEIQPPSPYSPGTPFSMSTLSPFINRNISATSGNITANAVDHSGRQAFRRGVGLVMVVIFGAGGLVACAHWLWEWIRERCRRRRRPPAPQEPIQLSHLERNLLEPVDQEYVTYDVDINVSVGFPYGPQGWNNYTIQY